MRAIEVLEHFLARSSWVQRAGTVDRIIAGDGEAEFSRCAVCWMPSMGALREMLRQDIRLMVCHEPTFWNHHDQLGDDPAVKEKIEFIRANGITVIRNHDCWDRWPGIGIPWAWAKFLGVGERPVKTGNSGYQHRYDIEPTTVGELATRMAGACAKLGESAVQMAGDAKQAVSKIGIGTGCACVITTFIEMGCDCSVVCDDGTTYWGHIQRAKEIGHPVLRANHGTSEEPGMVTMTRYINENLKGMTAVHIPHGSTFELVGGAC